MEVGLERVDKRMEVWDRCCVGEEVMEEAVQVVRLMVGGRGGGL